MVPLDVPRSDPPGWIDELRQAILWPNKSWAPAEEASILLATRELQGWLADRRSYAGEHKRPWLSAIADFEQSVRWVGPSLSGALGQELADAIFAANSLTADFGSSNNANSMAALLLARRTTDQVTFGRLSAHWAEPGTREAAWNDLAEACRDQATAHETLAVRRDLFWDLMRAADYGPDPMSQLLAGVLGGSDFYVTQARILLGDISGPGYTWSQGDRIAGLTDDELLGLCRRLLTTPPVPGHYAVWVAFGHTGLGGSSHKIGPISFWNCEWVKNVLEHDGPNFAPIPDELKGTEGFFRPDLLPSDRDVMLARVDLGTNAWTDPVRAATEQAEAVVALAGFRVGETKWRIQPGYLVAIDGRVSSMGSFEWAEHRDITTSLYRDSMDAQLVALTPKLQAHLPITDPDLSEIVQAIRWWEQARPQSPLPAVLLQVRVLELLSQRVGGLKWYDYLDQYQRASWVRHGLVARYGSLIDECLYNHERLTDPQERAWLRQFSLAIRTYQPDGATIDFRRGLNEIPRLAALFPPHDKFGRRLRSAAGRFTVPGLISSHDDLENTWSLTLARLVRVRNALAHGGPIEDKSAATVRDFVEQLAAWSLSVTLEGLLEGKSIQAANNAHKQSADHWSDTLSAATNATDALIGP